MTTWPTHRAKARQRRSMRKRIARRAQQAIAANRPTPDDLERRRLRRDR